LGCGERDPELSERNTSTARWDALGNQPSPHHPYTLPCHRGGQGQVLLGTRRTFTGSGRLSGMETRAAVGCLVWRDLGGAGSRTGQSRLMVQLKWKRLVKNSAEVMGPGVQN